MLAWIKNLFVSKPEETPEQKGLRRSILIGLGGLVLGASLTFSCKPSFKKEYTETLDQKKQLDQTVTALREQNTTLVTANSAYEKRQKVRRSQKGYLDGTGQPVFDILPDGSKKAVVLETVTILSSDAGSASSSIFEQKYKDSLLEITSYKDEIKSLKHSLEERRGGTTLYGSYGSNKWAGADLNFKSGLLGYGAGFQINPTNPTEWAVTGRLGLDLSFLGL